MSNEIQKLKPVERSLYRRVFMAAIDDLMSPEAADKRALHAVKIWHTNGAFNEERDLTPEPGSSLHHAANLYDTLRAYMNDPRIPRIDDGTLAAVVLQFVDENCDLAEFRRRLGLDRESSG